MHGILLVNLGTPTSYQASDVKRYLKEFLLDERVVTLPYLQRNLLVQGLIIPRRYKESAAAYESIWTKEGSPLLVYSQNIRSKLQERMGNSYQIELAMRYQEPALSDALTRLSTCEKITIVPLFPQYASATTGSIYQKVFETMQGWNTFPELRIVSDFPTHPGFIKAQAAQAPDLTEYDVVMSFHGLPVSQLDSSCLSCNCCKKNTRCYRSQCYQTAEALAQRLGIDEYHVCFQSRLGKDPWIEPYTSDVLARLATEGKGRVAVFCPSFVADCLETIEEISVQYEELFLQKGGRELIRIPCVNDHEDFIDALVDLTSPSLHPHHTSVPL